MTAAGLLLLLSRSEIRKTLFSDPITVPILAATMWAAVFLFTWWRDRKSKRKRSRDRGSTGPGRSARR